MVLVHPERIEAHALAYSSIVEIFIVELVVRVRDRTARWHVDPDPVVAFAKIAGSQRYA